MIRSQQGVVDPVCFARLTFVLVRRAQRTAPDLQRWFHWPGRNPSNEFCAGSRTRDGCWPTTGQTQKDRAVDRIGLSSCVRRQRNTRKRQSDQKEKDMFLHRDMHAMWSP